jgi:predicted AAA+ superfamily ATPase
LGISNHTVNSWISILEASYIIVKLRPYFENFGKRLVKSPKIYFVDPGLLCYLLGIENEVQLQRDPLRGAIFENMVIIELIKHRFNSGKEHNLYFMCNNHNNEVDAVYNSANNLLPIEIKSAKTFTH